MTEIATPTAMRAEWWPAAVRIPDGRDPIQIAKVFAADTGLYVYTNEDAGDGTPRLVFHSPIDYDKTDAPVTGYVAAQAGIRIHTDAGEVIVQPRTSGGCCGHGRVKHWRPSWATRVQAWKG